MPRPKIGSVAVAAAALVTAVLAAPSSVAATDTYGDSMTVTFGTNAHSTVAVDLVLPAPGDARRVARVTFKWQQWNPTYQGSSTGSFTVETPQCTADAECRVHAEVPTGRMMNGVQIPVSVVVSDGSGTIGSTSRDLNIQNPKPTIALTAPGNYATFWNEQVTIAADATPSSSGTAIKQVRFYVNPTGKEDDPYSVDDTAPYSVAVPSSQIAESTKRGTLYAVAEDVEGNLSQYGSETTKPFIRYVRVGPPPTVSWLAPAVDGAPAGGMSNEALLHWYTELPDSAPPGETDPTTPYIDRIEISRDGEPLVDMRYSDPIGCCNDFGDRKKVRATESNLYWRAVSGMTPGEHTVTLRVTTSYGSVGTATRRFVVTDGVKLGRVMSGTHVVEDGRIVTAGTWVPLRFYVAGKVPGSALTYYDVLRGDESLIGGSAGCQLAQWWDCPEQITVRTKWSVPSKPGTYTLTFVGQESFDAAPTTTTRTFKVQPAGAIRVGVSTNVVRVGKPVTVSGRVVRTDTGHGVRGVPVTLQWRKAGTTRWTSVVSRTSRLGGRVRALPVRRSTGFYRWVSPGVLGRLGPSRSKALKVRVDH
jgi:hypothetical protein